MAQQDKAEIEAVYDAMYRYEIAKDVGRLGDLLTDDYILVHMTGMRQPKQAYLDAVRDGDLNYYAETKDRVTIEMQDASHAVMVGDTRVEAAVFGGARRTWPLRLTIRMEKVDGRWLMAGAEASMY